jgi:hypothetical protein
MLIDPELQRSKSRPWAATHAKAPEALLTPSSSAGAREPRGAEDLGMFEHNDDEVLGSALRAARG